MPNSDLGKPHAVTNLGRNIVAVICTLSDILAKREMSNRDLARQAGVTANTVGNLCKAHFSASPIVSLASLGNVCVALDILPGDVLRLEENVQHIDTTFSYLDNK